MDRLYLIVDPIIVPYIKLPFDITELFFGEIPISILSANHTPNLLCDNMEIVSIPDKTFERTSRKGFFLKTALEFFAPPPLLSRDWYLLMVISASQNECSNLELANLMGKVQNYPRCNTIYVDLGSFLSRSLNDQWENKCDYLVKYNENTIKKEHINSLLAWIPNCFEGFTMYLFEGHHPGEETWLNSPPKPFTGYDFAFERKNKIFSEGI